MMLSAVHNPARVPNQTLAPRETTGCSVQLLAGDAHSRQSGSCAARVGRRRARGANLRLASTYVKVFRAEDRRALDGCGEAAGGARMDGSRLRAR
jgi:hypothetical protein